MTIPVDITRNNETSKQPNSGLAVASFILGLLSFIPLVGVVLGITAIVLGLVGKRFATREGGHRPSLSKAGIILGLCGIAFTILLYGSLYYWGFKASTGPFASLRPKASQQFLTQDAGQLELYKLRYGRYPDSLHALSSAGFSVIFGDHYLRPFYYKVANDSESYDLRSLGPDGVYGTADDIFPAK
jgi:hypothetical protein